MPTERADASDLDHLVREPDAVTDNVGPEDYPDPPQDPDLEDEDASDDEGYV
jgi:hypothetical protein